MKRVIVPICVLLLSVTALAQTRSRTTTRRGSATKPATSSTASAVKTEGATRIATQIKNLTTFLYLLGGVAKDLDAQAAAARSGSPSPTQERNMAKIAANFEDFRIGLESLETYFSSTSELRPYYAKLLGSADIAATAKSQAATGHVDQAGHILLNIVNRLTDVLADIR
jgi:hypothetical protein